MFSANRNTQKNMQFLDKIHTVFTATLKRLVKPLLFDIDSRPAGLGMDIIACTRPALSTSYSTHILWNSTDRSMLKRPIKAPYSMSTATNPARLGINIVACIRPALSVTKLKKPRSNQFSSKSPSFSRSYGMQKKGMLEYRGP